MRSMHSWIVPAAVAVLAGGCTYDELRRDTSNVEKTMADLRFEGILNNLALMAHNPAALPNPVAVSTGNVSVSDLGTASTNDMFNPHGLTQWQLAVASLQRQVTEQWALQPLHKPDKLRLMRCAFDILLDSPLATCGDPGCGPDCYKRLRDFLATEDTTPDLHCSIPRGWFSVGRACDVPKDACFSAHYCDTYVWVMPDGIDGLSRFTLTILRIALTDQEIPAVTVTRKFKGDGQPTLDNLTSYTVHSVELLPLGGEPKPITQTIDVAPAGSGSVASPPVLH